MELQKRWDERVCERGRKREQEKKLEGEEKGSAIDKRTG